MLYRKFEGELEQQWLRYHEVYALDPAYFDPDPAKGLDRKNALLLEIENRIVDIESAMEQVAS